MFHYSAPRVRAHVFLCMLAYYVEWHMRQRLKPLLFDDEYLEQARASRASPVLKAVRSAHAKAKDMTKTAADGTPLHSFRTLLADLGRLAWNITRTALNPAAKIVITTRPTPLQQKAFALLGLNPACTQQPGSRRTRKSVGIRTCVQAVLKVRTTPRRRVGGYTSRET